MSNDICLSFYNIIQNHNNKISTSEYLAPPTFQGARILQGQRDPLSQGCRGRGEGGEREGGG